jgi:rRNA-processing protein FCF1
MNVPYELCTLDIVLAELQVIMKGESKPSGGKKKVSGSDKFNAKLGYILAKQKGLKILKSSQNTYYVDDELVALAGVGIYIATLDKGLQKRLIEAGSQIITVRQNQLVLGQR